MTTMTKRQKRKRRAATAGAVVMTHSTTPSRRAAKRRATLGAGLLVLGVLHLSTKDASGAPTQCEIGHSNPPIVGPCPTGVPVTPPTTVVFEVTPYKPGDVTLAPPVQTAPATTTVTLAPPVSIVQIVAVVTGPVDVPQVIEEDDPRWDCHTMGNYVCGTVPQRLPATSGASSQSLPATGSSEVVFALAGVAAAMLVAGTTLVVAFPRRRKTIVIDLPMVEG